MRESPISNFQLPIVETVGFLLRAFVPSCLRAFIPNLLRRYVASSLRRSIQARSLAVAVLTLLVACNREAPPAPIAVKEYIQPDTPPTYVAPRGATAAEVSFTDVTRSAGIAYTHVNGAFGEKWMPETMGGGGGFFDYDGDGWADLLLINSGYWTGHEGSGPRPTHKLYRNRRDGTFEDVTALSGLDEVTGYGMGFSAADFDGDGDEDVYVTNVGKNRLLRNDAGKLIDVTDAAGVGFSTCDGVASEWEWSTGALWIDHDRDGDLDLFVCNYIHWTPKNDIWNTWDGSTKAYATPQPYQGATNVLFRNKGDGTFEDATKSTGVYNPEGKSLGVVADDFNDDGWADLFVSNDTQPNFLYMNNQDGTFTDRALSVGVAYDEAGLTRAGMGVSVADLDRRGMRSIAIGNFSGEPVSLFTQVGGDAFVDRAGATRLSRPTEASLTFGVLFADLNLDGFEDLTLANGHIEPEIERVRSQWKFKQPPQLFINTRNGQFVEMTEKAGASFAEPIVGRSVATADIDHDGDLDLLITSNGGPAKLLRNDLPNPNRAIRVRLSGAGGKGSLTGAMVHLRDENGVQSRFLTTGGSYLSQSESVATFGRGDDAGSAVLTVRWPDGAQSEVACPDSAATFTLDRKGQIVDREPFRPTSKQ